MTSSSASAAEVVSVVDLDEFMQIVSIKCDLCDALFSTKSEWEIHAKNGHLNVINSAEIADNDQVLISSLLALAGDSGSFQHVNILGNNDVYLCGECSAEFPSSEKCSEHVNYVHHPPPEMKIRINPEQPVLVNPEPVLIKPKPPQPPSTSGDVFRKA
jgi:uncharacterized C2H2 Zn-finger protein